MWRGFERIDSGKGNRLEYGNKVRDGNERHRQYLGNVCRLCVLVRKLRGFIDLVAACCLGQHWTIIECVRIAASHRTLPMHVAARRNGHGSAHRAKMPAQRHSCRRHQQQRNNKNTEHGISDTIHLNQCRSKSVICQVPFFHRMGPRSPSQLS